MKYVVFVIRYGTRFMLYWDLSHDEAERLAAVERKTDSSVGVMLQDHFLDEDRPHGG